MSSNEYHSLDLLGLNIKYPHFDIIFKLLNNKEYFLGHNFTKFFFLLGTLLASKFLIKLMIDKYSSLKNILKVLLPLDKVDNNKWITILGFGDNEVSVTIAKYFASRGYNLLLLICPKVLKVRREYNLNQIQQIDQLSHVKIIEYDYDSFISSSDFSLENGQIEYLFDTTVLRIYNEDLDKEDISNHLNSFFFNKAISTWTMSFLAIYDKLRVYFYVKSEIHPIKVFLFTYPDKNDEVNHKIFYEFRKTIYKQYQEIYKNTLVFNIIKYMNEFKGYYIKDSQLKRLEVVKFPNNGFEINFN